jgi:hypothetical protein
VTGDATDRPSPGSEPPEEPASEATGAAGAADGRDVTDLTDDHERRRAELGGYVLGSLTVAEQEAVEVHLDACPSCRDELAELEAIPVLLDLARPPVVPSGGGGHHTGTGVAAPRAGRSRVLVGAAAAVAVVAALVVGVLIGRSDQPDFGPPIALEPVAGPAAEAEVTPSGTAALRPTDHGTAVRLDLEGLPAEGTWYECTWSSGQGERSAGTFRPGADGSVQIDLTTAARIYSGWQLTIVEHQKDVPEGEPVLEASD